MHDNIQPHLWTNIADTKFTLARIQKLAQVMDGNQEEVSTETSRPMSSVNALRPEHIVGYAYGGQRPHSDHEHVTNPNAIVIHNHNGIEVLNILSGEILNLQYTVTQYIRLMFKVSNVEINPVKE